MRQTTHARAIILIVPTHPIANSEGNILIVWFKSTLASIVDHLGGAIFFYPKKLNNSSPTVSQTSDNNILGNRLRQDKTRCLVTVPDTNWE